MSTRWNRNSAAVALAAFAVTFAASPATAKDFSFSEKANPRLAKKLDIPIWFTLPSSTRLPLSGNFNTSDLLVDFKHPDAIKSGSDAGLRIVSTRRSGMSERLAKSGIFQTGDLLLTFRAEWGGAGAYPNVQMGISHTGLAYIKDGKLLNLDNPLTTEYHGAGMRSDLTSSHYKTLDFIHVVRPRGLTDSDRANIGAWANRFRSSASSIYPSQLSFNDDYNAPKYKSARNLEFVKTVGQIALGQKPAGKLDMYCSEFVWSVLSLRGCDPATTAEQFKGNRTPSCIKMPMEPMDPTGNAITSSSKSARMGLVDGPLHIIDRLKVSDAERKQLLEAVFTENPSRLKKMSHGHRQVAQTFQPQFEKLRDYYLGVKGSTTQRLKARLTRATFNASVEENYSPTSFLVNTLLPPENSHRSMDYVATIVIE